MFICAGYYGKPAESHDAHTFTYKLTRYKNIIIHIEMIICPVCDHVYNLYNTRVLSQTCNRRAHSLQGPLSENGLPLFTFEEEDKNEQELE